MCDLVPVWSSEAHSFLSAPSVYWHNMLRWPWPAVSLWAWTSLSCSCWRLPWSSLWPGILWGVQQCPALCPDSVCTARTCIERDCSPPDPGSAWRSSRMAPWQTLPVGSVHQPVVKVARILKCAAGAGSSPGWASAQLSMYIAGSWNNKEAILIK